LIGMRVSVGDVRLFVEVVGQKLEVRDGVVVERPTVVLLHGGPMWDHLTLRTDFEPLADVAQLVFYDHRGLGRSDRSDRAHWTLKQWAADLAALLDKLGIAKPIVLGQSFGGMVAQQFAIDHPDRYAGLILSATAARFNLEEVVATFRLLGGDDMATLARDFFTAAGGARTYEFLERALPHYTWNRREIGALSPFEPHVLEHFFSDAGDGRRFDHRPHLKRLTAPTLILGGEADPVISAEAVQEAGAAFADGVATVVVYDQCGHGPTRDRPDLALPDLRRFIQRVAG
jgi:pimeloyl-ACP methyl ester carboxylesterase